MINLHFTFCIPFITAKLAKTECHISSLTILERHLMPLEGMKPQSNEPPTVHKLLVNGWNTSYDT